jgi:hypothetical protein
MIFLKLIFRAEIGLPVVGEILVGLKIHLLTDFQCN